MTIRRAPVSRSSPPGKCTALGGGVHAIGLSGLAVGPGEVWVGGLIAETDSADRAVPSAGIARYVVAP